MIAWIIIWIILLSVTIHLHRNSYTKDFVNGRLVEQRVPFKIWMLILEIILLAMPGLNLIFFVTAFLILYSDLQSSPVYYRRPDSKFIKIILTLFKKLWELLNKDM